MHANAIRFAYFHGRAEHVNLKPKAQMRLVGASVPTIVKDGRFLTSEGLIFFEMHNPDKCITVTLNHEHYKKIVFEVDDNEAMAKHIRDAIKSQPNHNSY
jgi:hypothetical protein